MARVEVDQTPGVMRAEIDFSFVFEHDTNLYIHWTGVTSPSIRTLNE